MSMIATLVISVRIGDEAAFVAAAQAKAQQEGLSRLAARTIYNGEHLAGCVHLLIEPDKLPAGCDLVESGCRVETTT